MTASGGAGAQFRSEPAQPQTAFFESQSSTSLLPFTSVG